LRGSIVGLKRLEANYETLRGAHAQCYPCQTCLPQVQCTVSVGPCLVNCRLQIGQGLVITYVIILPPS